MAKILKTKESYSPQAEEPRSLRTVVVTLILPAVVVAGIFLFLAQRQGGIEAGLANFTRLLPIGFAFSAGMVASVNPCGVVMLTTYAFQRMGEARQKTAGRQVLESIAHTLAITLSFVIIFLGVGSLIAAGSQALLDYFPLAGLLIGVVMAVVGTWLFVKRKTLSLNLAVLQSSGEKLSVWSDLLFGLSYAVASLSCTLPIFLVVAGNALSAGDFRSAVVQFGAYALGMGTVVLVVVLGAVLFKRALARWLRGVTPFVHRLSSLFLAGAGVYIVIYWLSQGILF
jgi:cytochrome c biogenesis protein CcdA